MADTICQAQHKGKKKRMIKKILDFEPKIGKGSFIAETAAVIGDVTIGEKSSVWYSAVIRGDVNKIRIGSKVSIQDGCVLHCSDGTASIEIGDNVTIGHNATIHGCRIDDYCLIGMGSTLLDNAHIGKGSIVAAGALVLRNTMIGEGELWGGVPARFIKKISPEAADRLITPGVQHYEHWTEVYLLADEG